MTDYTFSKKIAILKVSFHIMIDIPSETIGDRKKRLSTLFFLADCQDCCVVQGVEEPTKIDGLGSYRWIWQEPCILSTDDKEKRALRWVKR